MNFLLALLLAAPVRAAESDLWLEEVEGTRALSWVAERNEESVAEFDADTRTAPLSDELRAIFAAEDRIPWPKLQEGRVTNFWQDAANPKGLWRRATLEEYAKPAPAWETLLDIDRLSSEEHESWVFKGAFCQGRERRRCMLSLSRGGKDAVEMREFDADHKTFLPDGFRLAESKTELAWLDADTLLVATDFGPGSMTGSGYPRSVRLWKRGTPLSGAKPVFEAARTDIGATPWTAERPEGRASFITHYITFYETELLWVRPDGTLRKVPLPTDASVQGLFQERLLVLLRSDWKTQAQTFPAGALVALPFSASGGPGPESALELVEGTAERRSLESVAVASSTLYLTLLDNVKGRLERVRRGPGGWTHERVALPDNGSVSAVSADDFSDTAFASYEGFLTPPTLYALEGGAPRPLKELPARFDASGLVVEQDEAVSADGTRVPYFLIKPAGSKPDGSLPVILYGYGGFEYSLSPEYPAATGKAWLEKGGGYAVANIRGGGEFGPAWHKAALGVNRQRAYDDFIAVAEDLVRRRVTSTKRLGISGRSNGGLLVGAAAMQRPELFGAVACGSPLLDMLRYDKLLAGASWTGEYGDPADPVFGAAIRKYSPYQNAKEGAPYPRIYFYTSTKDDRVHPGHARRMAAKLLGQGHPVLYYENTEGGHSAAADLEQRVRMTTYQFVYFLKALF